MRAARVGIAFGISNTGHGLPLAHLRNYTGFKQRMLERPAVRKVVERAVAQGKIDFAPIRQWLRDSEEIVAGQIYRLSKADRGLRRHEWKALYRALRMRRRTPNFLPFISGREVLLMNIDPQYGVPTAVRTGERGERNLPRGRRAFSSCS